VSARASFIKLMMFTAVTVVVTMVLGATIGNVRPGDKVRYRADFTDVTGLLNGDEVRIAGVTVGRIKETEVVDGHARVTLEVDKAVVLTESTRAKVRYRNLLGQRYIALFEGSGTGSRLRADGLIPIGQTEPALDLTVLFNGFRPILETVQPETVNQLASEIVRTLQGEGGTVDSLLAHTASLTTTLAARDATIGRVIDNLNSIVGTVADREGNVGLLISELQRLVTGLAGDRDALGSALASIDKLTGTTADLVHDARPPLDASIAHLNKILAVAAAKVPQLDAIAEGLPTALSALDRALSYGAWLNLYVLDLKLNVNGTLIPIPPGAVAAALSDPAAKPATYAAPQPRGGGR
jgi:phospholipid/cholesterol/gamma-HCH transport system substrate-binding protein